MDNTGSTAPMPQDQARWLFDEGAVLVFLDVPAGTEFGIDYNSWEVGPQFRGVKMIPPGIHFIYYSAVNVRHREVAPRTGFFHNFKQREVLVRKWDSTAEDICTEPISEAEQERLEMNKREMDRYLGAYPYDSYKKWVSLTSHINSDLLHKLMPLNNRITSVPQLESESSNSESRKQAMAEKMETEQSPDLLKDLKHVPGTEIRFTNIPRQKYPPGASAVEITKYSMDHSYCLQNLIDVNYVDNSLDLLGELQFAFVCFLVGQVFDAFEQWKKLVHLLCSCEEAISVKRELYSSFISLLHYHIQEIPEDFFVDIVASDNFLVSAMRDFFVNLQESGCPGDLLQRGLRFKKHLEKKYKWDLSSESDECAAVMVE